MNLKYCRRSEMTEQIKVINWCAWNAAEKPELNLIFHIPNGGSRDKREAANLKAQGVKAGVPDLFLPVARNGCHGLFIEMKFGKNKPTDKQKEWLHELAAQGYRCDVCYSADEAIFVIEAYLRERE